MRFRRGVGPVGILVQPKLETPIIEALDAWSVEGRVLVFGDSLAGLGTVVMQHHNLSPKLSWSAAREATVEPAQQFFASAHEAGVTRFVYLSDSITYAGSKVNPTTGMISMWDMLPPDVGYSHPSVRALRVVEVWLEDRGSTPGEPEVVITRLHPNVPVDRIGQGVAAACGYLRPPGGFECFDIVREEDVDTSHFDGAQRAARKLFEED